MNYKVFLVGFIIIVMVLTVALIISLYYRKPCDGKCLYFGVDYAHKGDKLKLFLNDKLEYERTYSDEHMPSIKTSESLIIDDYCTGHDSVKVQFTVNQLDTTFYINPDSIRGTYLSISQRSIRLIVFHNYYVGGLRDNASQD